jgi:hypothetical protein
MVGRGPPDPQLFPRKHTTSPGASRGHALPAAAAPIRNAHLRPATPPWRDDLRVVRSFSPTSPPPPPARPEANPYRPLPRQFEIPPSAHKPPPNQTTLKTNRPYLNMVGRGPPDPPFFQPHPTTSLRSKWPHPTKPNQNPPPIPQHGRARASGPAALSAQPHHLPRRVQRPRPTGRCCANSKCAQLEGRPPCRPLFQPRHRPPRRVQRPTPTGRCRANSKYPPPPISPLKTKPP